MNPNEIPIIINCFNRLSCLKQLINFLEKKNIKNPIILLDNKSTYEPLLEYYKSLPYEVIYLNDNLGHEALWISGLIHKFNKNYFVLTDPDVVPIDECPANFMEYFLEVLLAHPEFKKVGFSLKIDDLPDHFPHKQSVIEWEKQFWQTKVGPNLWKSQIDTTFALFHPSHHGAWGWAIRTDYPYTARHTTWYLDPANLPDDERYYLNCKKTITHWSKQL